MTWAFWARKAKTSDFDELREKISRAKVHLVELAGLPDQEFVAKVRALESIHLWLTDLRCWEEGVRREIQFRQLLKGIPK